MLNLSQIESRLIDDWRRSWRFGIMWLHTAATAAAVYIVNNPGALNNLAYSIPPGWRRPILFTLGGLWFLAGWLIRVWKGKPNG
jgi:H+/Cl- antiporter ClcA